MSQSENDKSELRHVQVQRVCRKRVVNKTPPVVWALLTSTVAVQLDHRAFKTNQSLQFSEDRIIYISGINDALFCNCVGDGKSLLLLNFNQKQG